MNYLDIINDLQKLANRHKAKILQRFFKTGKGEYGEGDIFWGITVPQQRLLARKYQNLALAEIKKLLKSKIHELRLTGLLILTLQFPKAEIQYKKTIVDFYCQNIHYINNWDLVDLSAPNILGSWLIDKNKSLLYKLAKSKNLWEKRIAILSTYTFIKQNQFDETLKIASILLNNKHDLIHKAAGWMLREVGKRKMTLLEKFLDKYAQKMPRVMLRYAIEKMNPEKRNLYLSLQGRAAPI